MSPNISGTRRRIKRTPYLLVSTSHDFKINLMILGDFGMLAAGDIKSQTSWTGKGLWCVVE